MHTEESKFEVFVSGFSSTVEEWRRALKAPASELPRLNQEQRDVAKKFGISEQEYARGYLAGLYGQERLRQRGTELGKAVEGILAGLAPGHRLSAMVAEITKLRWVARIHTPEKPVNVAIPRELADDIVDSNTIQDQEKLKVLVLTSLGHPGLISKR